MSSETRDDDGFGLIEAVIALMLLAVIALALAPVLWNGLAQSKDQSNVATATRQLNAVVERARLVPDCAHLIGYAGEISGVPAGVGFDIEGAIVPSTIATIPTPAPSPHCDASPAAGRLVPGEGARVRFQATEGGKVIAVVDAVIRIPKSS